FDRDAQDLTVAQGALLAGLIRNPTGYDPTLFPDLARARRDFALERMVTRGHLSEAAATALKDEPMPAARNIVPPPNDYFVEEIKQRLLDDPRLGETPQERYNAVFKGGLTITATIDHRLQKVAEEKVRAIVPDTKGRFTAAVVTVEPKTGRVRAMVAGPGFEQVKYNLVTQGRRQPGSSFKAYVVAAAMENGYGPNDTVNGTQPCSVVRKGSKPYNPGNYEGSAGAVTSISGATARSMNCAFIRLGLAVGHEKVIDIARRLGVTSPLDPVDAMFLGTEELTPLEQASAYGVFANDGVRHAPYFVERVLDRDGKVIFEGPDEGEQVISQQAARMTTQVLRGVVTGGTGVKARLPRHPVAGKTGTSQDYENAWFVGYTPQLATAVWMGAPVGNVPMRNVGGIRVTGGSYPARIWGAYMTEAMKDLPVEQFGAPDPKLIPKRKSVQVKLPGVKVSGGGGSGTTVKGGTPPPDGRPGSGGPGKRTKGGIEFDYAGVVLGRKPDER
ncbi:MAG TPA: penicillin-binding transpeptidase domain-containing protein, partial [Acidimicrobiales bacterium]|nr:penicillin-binding transpeptidase domain-containing protein [Acidimicrobiales bacterium]